MSSDISARFRILEREVQENLGIGERLEMGNSMLDDDNPKGHVPQELNGIRIVSEKYLKTKYQ